MAITKAQIEDALDDLIAHEEGFRFQSLGVILATQKCKPLVAHEKKNDLGLDAYAPGTEFEDRRGRGAACSITATLAKIRADIKEAQKEFKDLGILYFVTPRPVTEKKIRKDEEWVQKVEREWGITLIVMSREHVVTALLSPENAALCASHLHIPSEVGRSLEKVLGDCRMAIQEVNAAWKAKVEGIPLIELSADRLTGKGMETGSQVELADLEDMLAQGLRLSLEAPAGRGKTTTLVQLAERRTAAGSLAFLIDLPSWAQESKDILDFIAGMHPFKARSIHASTLAQLYQSQPFVFLLNGWNEIAEADMQRASTALGALVRDYRAAGVLVATRVHQVTPPLPGTTVRTRLRSLTPTQRAEYVSSRLAGQAPNLLWQLNSDSVLDDLTRTPFFLAEVVSIAAAGKDIPKTKMGVLRAVIHLVENDPTHRSALEGNPLFGQAGAYLTVLASTMTSKGQTQLGDSETRQVLIRTHSKLREEKQTDSTTTGLQVLDALTSHHVLEKLEYPLSAHRFEHQQLQEFYAAEFLKKELLELTARSNASLDALAASERAETFKVQYINESAWTEPLHMIASDLSAGSKDEVRAGALLVLLSLETDIIFAAELFGVSCREVQDLIADRLTSRIRQLWISTEKYRRSYALTAMVATGSALFKDQIVPLLKGSGGTSRFEVYRSTSKFRLSSLGPDWQQEVGSWNENARLTFVSEMNHVAAPLRELAAFALRDPSVKVRARAFSNLMWINTDEETTRLLTEVDEEAFEDAIESTPLRNTHPIFRTRALTVYRKVLRESSDPEKRFKAAGNAVLMGEFNAQPVLREYFDQCSADRVRALAQRELRPLLDALSFDPAWRTTWVIHRVLEGALSTAEWSTFIVAVNEDIKNQLLARLETEDLSLGRGPGVQGLLRLCADSGMACRIFCRIVELQRAINTANSVRSQENITLAQQLAALERQLQDFLRGLPAQTMLDGILVSLSPEFSLDELSAWAELWDWGMDNEPDKHEVLTDASREAARAYLRGAVPLLTNENDPRGEVRSHLAVAISRVGEPEDTSDIAALMASDVQRIRLGMAAKARRERSLLAEGSVMRYTNRYMLAVRQLKSESEGPFLAGLLAEPEFEREVSGALVEWAKTKSLPVTAGIEGWGNLSRDFKAIWEARSSRGMKGFDEARRTLAVGYLRDHIRRLRQPESGTPVEASIVWRLRDLVKALAVLDGRNSSTFILDVLALPLQTHGTDGWRICQTLEVLLFEGATLPNEKTLALITPVIDDFTSKWHSDNDLYLLGTSLSILPFLDDPRDGIAKLAERLDRIRVPLDGMRSVVTALGHSRCDDALDILLSIVQKNGLAQHIGRAWINAIAALDNAKARDILMSFIDPEVPEVPGTQDLGRDVSVPQRIAEAAVRHPDMKARILALCSAGLDHRKREVLSAVIAIFKDGKSLLASLNLLDDESYPELPYELREVVEEAFVERQPVADRSNTYTLQPRTATALRDRLIEMTKSDPKRKQSALGLLAMIESWRLEYGRPIGETRNPVLGTDTAWPPEGRSVDVDEV